MESDRRAKQHSEQSRTYVESPEGESSSLFESKASVETVDGVKAQQPDELQRQRGGSGLTSSGSTPPVSDSSVSIQVISPTKTPTARPGRRVRRRPSSPDRWRPAEVKVVDYDADEEGEEENIRGRQRARRAELPRYYGSASAGPASREVLSEEPELGPDVPMIAVPAPPGRGRGKLLRSKTYEPGTLPFHRGLRGKEAQKSGIPIPPDRKK